MDRTFDKQLELRDVTAGAVTATSQTSAFALPAAKSGAFKVIVHVTALDTASGNETYALSIEADTASGFSSPVAVATLPGITAVGVYEIPLSAALVEQHEPGATHLRLKHTLGGTTPSITYGAFLAPVMP